MCIHRRALSQPCPSCQRICEEMDDRFERLVFLGHFNARGYTEAEWKATQKGPWR